MSGLQLSGLSSLRRQHLLAEFTGLKQACPEGVFISLVPGDPSIWYGVIFSRKGPYKNAILRFQITFPDDYPRLPPLVTFSTDMFHPLITPLTTYMYTTDIQDNGTVSATDEERLPPGGFSLRHGFPGWFGRKGRSQTANAQQQQPPATPSRTGADALDTLTTPDSRFTAMTMTPGDPLRMHERNVSTYEVLHYIRSTFDDETVLDSIPLEAAGNPGAWHAWRTRQRQLGKELREEASSNSPDLQVEGDTKGPKPLDSALGNNEGEQQVVPGPAKKTQITARKPGEWNWEGVWEDRVKKGIAAALSDPVLYGGATAGDDLIHFLPMEESDVTTVKDNLLRTLGNIA